MHPSEMRAPPTELVIYPVTNAAVAQSPIDYLHAIKTWTLMKTKKRKESRVA